VTILLLFLLITLTLFFHFLLTAITIFAITTTNLLSTTLTRAVLETTSGTLLARHHTTLCTFMCLVSDIEVAVAIEATLLIITPINVRFIVVGVVIRIVSFAPLLLFANIFYIYTTIPIGIPRIAIIEIMFLRPIGGYGTEELNALLCYTPLLESFFFFIAFEEGTTYNADKGLEQIDNESGYNLSNMK
jgi:hypothetical protein